MELRHYRYFVAAAEEMHFTRAAARLGIRQPSLSQQMNDLEAELETNLFRRLPQGIELTEAGKVFLEQARSVLTASDVAVLATQRAARGELGRLRVGFTGSSIFNPRVPSMIRSFKQGHPDVTLELRESNTAYLLAQLEEGSLDAAFVRTSLADDYKGAAFLLEDEQLVAVLPMTHPCARFASVSLPDLSGEALIMFPRVIGPSLYDAVILACRRSGFEPILGQEAPQITSAVSLVAAGLGISIVPAAVAQVKIAGVSYISLKGQSPVTNLSLAWREDNQSALLRQFIQLCRDKKFPETI